MAIYVGQELVEGLLASGHPGGLHGVFGHGGWIAVPTAVAIGSLIALTLRVADAVIAFVAGRQRPGPRQRPGRPRHCTPLSVALPRLAPLARVGAGRAPPFSFALTVV